MNRGVRKIVSSNIDQDAISIEPVSAWTIPYWPLAIFHGTSHSDPDYLAGDAEAARAEFSLTNTPDNDRPRECDMVNRFRRCGILC